MDRGAPTPKKSKIVAKLNNWNAKSGIHSCSFITLFEKCSSSIHAFPKANYHLSKYMFFILTCGCEKLSDPCMKFSRKSLTQGTSSIILLSLPLAPRFPATILKDFCFILFSLGSDLEVLLVTVTFSKLYRTINFSFILVWNSSYYSYESTSLISSQPLSNSKGNLTTTKFPKR